MPCLPVLYRLGLSAVPQCTPAVSDPPMRCGRVVRDDFIGVKEQSVLIEAMERAMRGLAAWPCPMGH